MSTELLAEAFQRMRLALRQERKNKADQPEVCLFVWFLFVVGYPLVFASTYLRSRKSLLSLL
jgi:hypothetical protein